MSVKVVVVKIQLMHQEENAKKFKITLTFKINFVKVKDLMILL